MAQDLEQFSPTLKKLRYESENPRLGQLIAEHEPHANKSDAFLIKMEIKRLAQPVTRVIDLRDLIKSGCEPVQRLGITHYMDTLATEDFDAELARYGGRFCIGVYEHVVERVKNRGDEENAKSLAEQLPAPKMLSLTNVYLRRDERLYFATKVRVLSSWNGPENLQAGIEAITTDISESGVSLKIPAKHYIQQDTVYVQFVDLEREFTVREPLPVKYVRRATQIKQGHVYAMLTLDPEQPESVKETFGILVKKCIYNHKRRNRVSVDNTVDAVESKILEQYVLGRLAHVPVYLTIDGQQLVARTALATPENQALRQFLCQPSGDMICSALLNHAVIQEALGHKLNGQVDAFVLRFRDKSKQIKFAVLPYGRVAQSGYFKQVLHKAVEQGSARLLRFTLNQIDATSSCHVPSSVPDSAGEAFENLNRPPHSALLAEVALYQVQCVISDLTDSVGLLSDIGKPQQQVQPENIKPYLLSLNGKQSPTHQCVLESPDARQEDRFSAALKVKVSTRSAGNEIVREGMTESISTRGLHIVFDDKHPFYEADVVFIDLQLPFTSPPKTLTRQRYKIVASSLQDIRVAVAGNISLHDARIELRRLIYSHLDDLSAVGSQDPVYGLSKAVRNLYASNHPNLYASLMRQVKDHYVYGVMTTDATPALGLHDSLSDADSFNLLSKNLDIRTALFECLAQLDKTTHRATAHLVVVARRKRKAQPVTLVAKNVGEGFDYAKLKFLFNNMASLGNPRVIRIDVSLKSRFFDKYVRDEIRYLARYAKVKHEESLALIKNTTATVELIDLTALLVGRASGQE